jgi:hypothetical protein
MLFDPLKGFGSFCFFPSQLTLDRTAARATIETCFLFIEGGRIRRIRSGTFILNARIGLRSDLCK